MTEEQGKRECANCRHMAPMLGQGQCRRWPPHPEHGWPYVPDDGWCSKWKAKKPEKNEHRVYGGAELIDGNEPTPNDPNDPASYGG